MPERAQEAGLGAEALPHPFGRNADARMEELEREILSGRLVVDAPYVARRAASDQGDRDKPADAVVGTERRRGKIRRERGGGGRGEIALDTERPRSAATRSAGSPKMT